MAESGLAARLPSIAVSGATGWDKTCLADHACQTSHTFVGSHNSIGLPSGSWILAKRPTSEFNSGRVSTAMPLTMRSASSPSRSSTRKLIIHCCSARPKYSVSFEKGPKMFLIPFRQGSGVNRPENTTYSHCLWHSFILSRTMQTIVPRGEAVFMARQPVDELGSVQYG